MIIDSIENAGLYSTLNPLFKQAFDYIRNNDLRLLPAEKIVLVEDKLFIMVQEPDGKSPETALLETHRKYIDIQMPLASEEIYGWSAIEDCRTPQTSFDFEKDFVLYTDKPTTYFTLKPNQFVIFYPNDGHAPCIGEGKMKKIVVKVIL